MDYIFPLGKKVQKTKNHHTVMWHLSLWLSKPHLRNASLSVKFTSLLMPNFPISVCGSETSFKEHRNL
ncbi:hypothetical protein KIN20_019085 [Parelaphostrongylus tenuis]|uniref:Uncharacterized protein n=1 Tax=Parelaphostrongylus tenuis TaxID=148309 RepID=A0AAD5N1T6_PARTN|nr:hypothetical protein KIN20_019085 [Parelaphostrongylus tenuis]